MKARNGFLMMWCAAVMVLIVGCDDNLTMEERSKKADINIRYAREMAKLAEETGAAYLVQIGTDGRPSVGASTDFYFESDADVSVVVFGNAASGRKPLRFEPEAPADDEFVETIETNESEETP